MLWCQSFSLYIRFCLSQHSLGHAFVCHRHFVKHGLVIGVDIRRKPHGDLNVGTAGFPTSVHELQGPLPGFVFLFQFRVTRQDTGLFGWVALQSSKDFCVGCLCQKRIVSSSIGSIGGVHVVRNDLRLFVETRKEKRFTLWALAIRRQVLGQILVKRGVEREAMLLVVVVVVVCCR